MTTELEPGALGVDALAQEIRRVDGKHDLGAGQLAEALMPFIFRALSAPEAVHGSEISPYDIIGPLGAEIRRRNRVGDETEKGSISVSCEYAAASLVLNALRTTGFTVVRKSASPAPPEAAHPGATVEAAKTLEPFTTFAKEAVEQDVAGWVWSSRLFRDRICDWFGPSDFGLVLLFSKALAAPRLAAPTDGLVALGEPVAWRVLIRRRNGMKHFIYTERLPYSPLADDDVEHIYTDPEPLYGRPAAPTDGDIGALVGCLWAMAGIAQDSPDGFTYLNQSARIRIEQAATALAAMSAKLAEVERERDEARSIVRAIHWMAVRYADNRKSYAVGMCNDALRKAYDAGWLKYAGRDAKLDPQYARDGLSTQRAEPAELADDGIERIPIPRNEGTMAQVAHIMETRARTAEAKLVAAERGHSAARKNFHTMQDAANKLRIRAETAEAKLAEVERELEAERKEHASLASVMREALDDVTDDVAMFHNSVLSASIPASYKATLADRIKPIHNKLRALAARASGGSDA